MIYPNVRTVRKIHKKPSLPAFIHHLADGMQSRCSVVILHFIEVSSLPRCRSGPDRLKWRLAPSTFHPEAGIATTLLIVLQSHIGDTIQPIVAQAHGRTSVPASFIFAKNPDVTIVSEGQFQGMDSTLGWDDLGIFVRSTVGTGVVYDIAEVLVNILVGTWTDVLVNCEGQVNVIQRLAQEKLRIW